jgi:hypothetical protein
MVPTRLMVSVMLKVAFHVPKVSSAPHRIQQIAPPALLVPTALIPPMVFAMKLLARPVRLETIPLVAKPNALNVWLATRVLPQAMVSSIRMLASNALLVVGPPPSNRHHVKLDAHQERVLPPSLALLPKTPLATLAATATS